MAQHILLSIAEHPLGTVHNAALMILVDDISPADHVQSAKDVLGLIEDGMKSKGTNSPRIGTVTDVQMAGRTFSHQLFTWDSPTKTSRQEYFAILTKDHVLVFVLVADSNEELGQVQKLVDSLRFEV